MNNQLAFTFPLDTLRWEIAACRLSWVDASGVRHVRIVHAHSVDHGWPWWTSGWGWEDRR